MKNNFFKYNFNEIKKIINNIDNKFLNNLVKQILKTSKKNKKIIICGNGGSAATASHVAVDLSLNGKVKAINFNEADLITCFANDYGHNNWMKEAIKRYYDKGDLVILISSSGNSKNHIVAGNYCRNKNINLITFTGFDGKNKLNKLGKINFSLKSKNYNQIEMVHHIWLLLACDYITNTPI